MKLLFYREVIKKAKKAGFAFRRSTGSHEIWWNFKTKMTCVIPRYTQVAPGTLRSIINQMGVSQEEFNKL